MAKDILGEAGFHFDELNKLRVLDPEVSQQTTELKEECKVFVDSKFPLCRAQACISHSLGQHSCLVKGLVHTRCLTVHCLEWFTGEFWFRNQEQRLAMTASS